MATLAAKSLDNTLALGSRLQREFQEVRNRLQIVRLCLLIPLLLVCPNLAVLGARAPQVSYSSRSGNPSREMSAETIFKRFANRVLILTCDESAEDSKLASGVLVSADGFILTNAHVVEGCRNMTAVHMTRESRQSYVPVLKYCDELNDVAVLKIAGNGFDFFALPLHSPQIGERVFAIGNPEGLEHSAPISPGSSGGALISARGELLGINSFLLKESQNLNFAVPAATLAIALSRARARPGFVEFPQSGDKEFSIGLLYARGQGVTKDTAEAAKWYRQAADKGHAEAQATLGALYSIGDGVPQDYAQSAAWFRKAAEQGCSVAQNYLALFLSQGEGGQKDDAEAVKWWRRAAEQGDVAAQSNLASAYQIGTGVPTDYTESYFWWKVASAGKTEDVTPQEFASVLKSVGGKLSPAALSLADERARKWLAGHPINAEPGWFCPQ
jgi:S1-C subfamily serine protease